jgi:glucokinase
MHKLIGIDIGGTKCTVSLGEIDIEGNPSVIGKETVKTKDYPDPYQMIERLQDEIINMLELQHTDIKTVSSIGISCGGPLDSVHGIILSPPNLPGWDKIPIVELFTKKFNTRTSIQNDANACALAEWKFGAGKGFRNIIFLTFGTGLGAGLILDGRLYSGTNDMAGEVGHIRLENFGPVGYGKAGSFEGFCSGGGIAQLARLKVMEKLQMGQSVSFCKKMQDIELLTAQVVADAARKGDPLAKEIYNICGSYFGKGLSILIDILNPELIIIGSIFVRSGDLLLSAIESKIQEESLFLSGNVCRIVPAGLGESIGDYAALSVAIYNDKF